MNQQQINLMLLTKALEVTESCRAYGLTNRLHEIICEKMIEVVSSLNTENTDATTN